MKLILTQPVSGLGVAGDVVDVKDGYARNYLMPRKLGTAWTKGGQKQVDAILAGRESRSHRSEEEAKAAKAALQSTTVIVSARAGQGGRLFGAVTSGDIAEAIVASGGPQVDKRKIEVPTPIRNVGEHQAHVRLHDDVSVDVTVVVQEA
ncbi:50S ribosomal protein L9 [Ornithinimicrobium cryptoxanthini]|uniref:Large ribosomal subunit protein bL9 n=1 Tax=Ornithinimicrobium cryptoxanthini TaxID=2934161 RepID=A0ABY4YHR9_9MICO|nr:50S ribosomal protein L9 [Ornithinimicrobium cryptoxanthini]USQ76306.1 50S ribosomal protein L9 [Ornithinimicrobium cryptoxanthini]